MSKNKVQKKGPVTPPPVQSKGPSLFAAFIAALGDLTIGTSVGFLLLLVGVLTGTVIVGPPMAVLYSVVTAVVAIMLAVAGIGLKVYAAFVESNRP